MTSLYMGGGKWDLWLSGNRVILSEDDINEIQEMDFEGSNLKRIQERNLDRNEEFFDFLDFFEEIIGDLEELNFEIKSSELQEKTQNLTTLMVKLTKTVKKG